MASSFDVCRGISQVLAKKHDGGLEEGDKEIGLKREEDPPEYIADITDRKVMDGFGVKMLGNMLTIKYHGEMTLKEVQDKNFETEMNQMMTNISNFIKREYKKVTGNALSLQKRGDMAADVQTMNRKRTWVQAEQTYRVGGMDQTEEVGLGSEDKVDEAIKKFLAIGKESYPNAKKAKNVTRKKSDEG